MIIVSQENFLQLEVSGFFLREEGDFYYLDLRPIEPEPEGELRYTVLSLVNKILILSSDWPRSREESGSGSRRKLHRQSRVQQLSPVKEASTPVQAKVASQTSLDSTIDSSLGSEDSSLDMASDLSVWEGEDVVRLTERSSLVTNFSCIFQVRDNRFCTPVLYCTGVR